MPLPLQVPQLMVREVPQLSDPVTVPQFLPLRVQNAALVSASHTQAFVALHDLPAAQLPQDAVRCWPQLSTPVLLPHCAPSREQKAALDSGTHEHVFDAPQVAGDWHVPHPTVRSFPQLSMPDLVPHWAPKRAQNAALVSGVQVLPPPVAPPPPMLVPPPPPPLPPPTPPPVLLPPSVPVPPPVPFEETQRLSTQASLAAQTLHWPPTTPHAEGWSPAWQTPSRQQPLGHGGSQTPSGWPEHAAKRRVPSRKRMGAFTCNLREMFEERAFARRTHAKFSRCKRSACAPTERSGLAPRCRRVAVPEPASRAF